jgi:uncharacterized protein (UPF0303 family)
LFVPTTYPITGHRAGTTEEALPMTNTDDARSAEIPDFESFTYDDAWRLGAALVQRCHDEGLPMAIAVDLGEHRVFQAGLPGSSAMNAQWADRKANIVRHFDRSSVAVAERYGMISDFYALFGLDRTMFAASEGAVPIRVRGTLVGVLAVSGLESGGDHELALDALARLRDEQGRA